MNAMNEKGSNPSSSSLLSHHTTPVVLLFESSTSPEELMSPFEGSSHCGGCPEFTFTTSYHVDVDIDDPLRCFSPSNDVGDVELDDDFFSIYIDVKKLEEKQTINNVDLLQDDNINLGNGGGFVVEGGGGGRRKRTRKDKSKNIVIKTQKKKRRGQKTCLEKEEGFVEPRKAMASEELADLWSSDPKRAKRIMANRHSAARSKERKAQYILNLEEKVKTLNSELAFLNAQFTANQEETTDLVAQNSELKSHLQSMECQADQIDEQIEVLKMDMEWLKSATGDQTEQSQMSSTMCLQFPPSQSMSSTHHRQLQLLHHCQQSMLPPYLHIAATSQPLF